VVQDGVVDGSGSLDLVLQGLLFVEFKLLTLIQGLMTIDDSAFLWDLT
jgi:hypothetical protein